MTLVPSRREHARFSCRLSLQAVGAGARGPLAGMMLNLGIGGALVSFNGMLTRTPFTLRVACGAETMSFAARVVRIAGLDPNDRQATLFGVEFLHDAESKARARLLVDRVRSGANAA